MFLFQKKKALVDEAAQQQIVACIRETENNTAGEIRVFIENKCSYMNALDRAKELFFNLSMEKTSGRNGVIVYLAIQDRQFAIYGDSGIHEKGAKDDLWKVASEQLKQHLNNNDIAGGLCACIREIGSALSRYYPFDPAVRKNELPDEIVFGK